MKKLFFATILGALALGGASVSAQAQTQTQSQTRSQSQSQSQSGEELYSPFQVTLLTPLGTNGNRAHLYTNGVSLNLLTGVSRNERALSLAGLGNVILRESNGFQAAGLFNHVGGRGQGMLASGAVNITMGRYTGGQFAGSVNFARDIDGLQMAGAVNVAHNMDTGVQFAGGINFARDIDTGAQFSGGVNIARDMEGAQFAAGVNVARDIEGAQMSVVNVARNVDGLQIGVVNVARHADYAIGLVNISRDGEMGIGLGYNEIGTASVNFRSGGRVLYGIVGVGYNHRASDREIEGGGGWSGRANVVSFTGGMGAHINLAPWLRINNELTFENLNRLDKWDYDNNAFKAGFALMPAIRPVHWFEIFGGPSINFMQSRDRSMIELLPQNPLWENVHRGRTRQLFIGWQAGVQFIL
ncbi:MAG: hypothetical protein LBU97_03230 [Alistipes sp.]|jgi:hypothetical protein|nr:hypothetical protein [Alistipes sp.]